MSSAAVKLFSLAGRMHHTGPASEKKFDDIYNGFDTIPALDGRTDRETDRQTVHISIALYMLLYLLTCDNKINKLIVRYLIRQYRRLYNKSYFICYNLSCTLYRVQGSFEISEYT